MYSNKYNYIILFFTHIITPHRNYFFATKTPHYRIISCVALSFVYLPLHKQHCFAFYHWAPSSRYQSTIPQRSTTTRFRSHSIELPAIHSIVRPMLWILYVLTLLLIFFSLLPVCVFSLLYGAGALYYSPPTSCP